MRRDSLSLLVGFALTALTAGSASGQVFWVNEFHYDNAGTDSGEFVEIAAPASFADLSSVQFTLYNGGSGDPYGSSHPLSTFSVGDTVAGVTLYSKGISGIQNGPDGFALEVGGTVVQFLSYEDVFGAQSGPASGLTSVAIGVSESETTPTGSSLGLTGGGAGPGDFNWTSFGTASPGSLNPGQVVIPEPSRSLLAAGLLLAGFALWHRRPRARVPAEGNGSTTNSVRSSNRRAPGRAGAARFTYPNSTQYNSTRWNS